MTLREMIAAHPDKFYPQTWYEGEAFMDAEPRNDLERVPSLVDASPMNIEPRMSAADVAWLWICAFDAPVVGEGSFWSRYIWTNDFDSQHQRVYVGQNGKGLEIHRHLHLTDRWAVPV